MRGKKIFVRAARSDDVDERRWPCAASCASSRHCEGENMSVNKLTPVLYVDQIEPCVAFWVERLGFQKTVEVPEGDRLGFVILKDRDVEIMYQSLASAHKDSSAAAAEIDGGRTFLYVEVDRLEGVMAAMKGANVVLPE